MSADVDHGPPWWCQCGLADIDPESCWCWWDGEGEPLDVDYLLAFIGPPWITVTPRSEFL